MNIFNPEKLIMESMKDAVTKTVVTYADNKNESPLTPNGELITYELGSDARVIHIEYKTPLRVKHMPFTSADGIQILRKERKLCEHEHLFFQLVMDGLSEQRELLDEPMDRIISRLMEIRYQIDQSNRRTNEGLRGINAIRNLYDIPTYDMLDRMSSIIISYGSSNVITLLEDEHGYIDAVRTVNGGILFNTAYGSIHYGASIDGLPSFSIDPVIQLPEELDRSAIAINRAMTLISLNLLAYLDVIESQWKLDDLPSD